MAFHILQWYYIEIIALVCFLFFCILSWRTTFDWAYANENSKSIVAERLLKVEHIIKCDKNIDEISDGNEGQLNLL